MLPTPSKIEKTNIVPRNINKILFGNDHLLLSLESEYCPHPGPPGFIFFTKFSRVSLVSVGAKNVVDIQTTVVINAPTTIFSHPSMLSLKKLR